MSIRIRVLEYDWGSADNSVAVSPISFLKNPMILMAIVSMGLMFGMPYMMENSTLHTQHRKMIGGMTDTSTVDPEMKEEFEEMQKNGVLGSGTTNTAAQIQNFDLAGWMAGKTDSGSTQSPAIQAKKK